MFKVIGTDAINGSPRSIVVDTTEERLAWQHAESKGIIPRELIAVPADGTLTVKVNGTGAFSGWLPGAGATLNVVDGDDEFTVTATETFWIMLPLTPVIGNVYAPGAAPEAFTVNVDDPGSVTTRDLALL